MRCKSTLSNLALAVPFSMLLASAVLAGDSGEDTPPLDATIVAIDDDTQLSEALEKSEELAHEGQEDAGEAEGDEQEAQEDARDAISDAQDAEQDAAEARQEGPETSGG